jgi:hypothetical protein
VLPRRAHLLCPACARSAGPAPTWEIEGSVLR